jgi:uncharacterized repeat protein (TIGR01451 family)
MKAFFQSLQTINSRLAASIAKVGTVATLLTLAIPSIASGVIPALRGGEFNYDVKISPTATNSTVVTNNANFSEQDIVSSMAVNTASAISVAAGLPMDYSDAPISGTAPSGTGTNNYGNATHIIVSGLKLGANIDSETALIANADASGDGADDDGITLPNLTAGATSYSIPAANIIATGTGTMHAWIDFNKNGTFEAREYKSVAINSNTPAGALSWSGITIGLVGNTFARFRLTTDATVTSATPSGNAGDGEVEDYQVFIGKQTINNTPSATSCSVLGGILSGSNLFTPLDNGTFGSENGSPNQSPAINPYPGIVSGGNYRQFYSPAFTYGDYSYVANPVTPRNSSQHPGITDPVYGAIGRFFASDPNTSTPTLTTTLTGLTPNQFYEYSFWAANSEPRGNPNEVYVLINGQKIYTTSPLTAFTAALEWKKHTVSFTNGASTSIVIDLKSIQTGNAGNDFYLDNIELRGCNFTVDYGDAPPSYGDAIHTTIPTTPKVYLGAVAPDGETSTPLGGNNGAGADGDDAIGTDDEDAFATLPNIPVTGTYNLTNISVHNTSGVNAILHAWIDFNKNGQFEAIEYQSVAVSNGTTTANLSWTLPTGMTAGNTYARFRISQNSLISDNSLTTVDKRSKDAVINGEVEDYRVLIGQPQLSISGKVWNDADTDLTINNSEAGTNAGSTTLTVYAINTTTGKVIDKAAVNATDGSYQLSDIPKNLVGLKLRLSNNAALQIGDDAPTSPSIPNGWFFTGESFNGSIDPVIATLGDISLSTTTLNLTNENFGIRQSYTIAADSAPTTCAPDFRTTINTGIDASGAALSVGSNDLNWTAEWIAGPARGLYTPYATPRPVGVMPAVVTGKLAGTWINELPNAKWISYPFRLSPNINGDHRDANLDGNSNQQTDTVRVKYTATVTLPSNANTISVIIPVGVSVDNQFVSAKVNGVENIATPVQNAYASGFTSLQSFNLSQGWQAGVNTIEIVTDSGPPYTGFFLSVNAATTQVCSSPNVLLVKRITGVNGRSSNGSISLGTYDPETNTSNPSYAYDKNIVQAGLTPPSSTNWPNTTGATSSTFLLGTRNGGTTKTGDEIEYTIYFLSTGGASAKGVTICDRIPRYQTFVPDAFNTLTVASNTTPASPLGDRGIAVFQGSTTKPDTIYGHTNIGDGDAARYYPPGSTLPSACTQPALAEDNGSIVVNLGDLPNATNPGTPKESYGFLRFRAKVK